MTVGIDASRANEPKKTGTEWYAYHLIQELKTFDRANQYLLYSSDWLTDGLEDLPPEWQSRVLRSVSDILWTQLRLSLEMLIRPPDVLFVPAHTIPIIAPRATVLTVHDLGFEYYPELYKKVPIGPVKTRLLLEIGARLVSLGRHGNSEYDYHRWAMRFGVKHATRIIAVSEFTKRDVVEKYGVDPSKITVVPHGYDQRFYRPVEKGEKSSRRVLDLRPYILFVGRVERKKNILGLLEAYRFFRESTHLTHKLVIIGKPGLGYEEFQEHLKHFIPDIRRDIQFLDYVPEEETAEFYRFADLFFFPSFFEGFGIPIIQAMACGVPVVASNTTSLPEIAGGAAVLVNPHKPREMAEPIRQILERGALKDEWGEKGLRRARQFSWEKSAEMTLDVLQRAYYESRSRS